MDISDESRGYITGKIRRHISSTYRNIRIGIALVGFILPLALFVVGKMTGIDLQNSMSDYYHQGDWVRNIFVGSLWSIAITLALYKGFSQREDMVLNLAGFFALCVAMFPAQQCVDACSTFSLHGFSAIALFVCMAYVCLFCQKDSLAFLNDEALRKMYRKWYGFFGIAMVVSPVAAFIFISVLNKPATYIYFVELLGIYAFSGYWLAKTLEIRTTEKQILMSASPEKNVRVAVFQDL